jgi:predicted SnoaL-like aldol condensation-catalyzing enzyme
MGDRLAENKRTVLAFYDLAFNQGRPAEAVEKYVGDTYTQHDPAVADGKGGVVYHFTRLAREHPDKRARFLRLVAEGNYVVLHTHQAWPGGPDRGANDNDMF